MKIIKNFFISEINENKNLRLIILFLISFFIALYLTFFYKNYYPPEICYSTAHSFFYKYINRINNSNLIDLYPESIASADSFSFTLVIFSVMKSFGFTDCQTLGFVRFLANILPYLGTSLLSHKILSNFKNKKYFTISILLLLAIRISFYLPEYFPLSFLNFNYPWLMSTINNSIHINGIILNSFMLFILPIVFFYKNFYLKYTSLIIGGLINPLVITIFVFHSNISKFLKNFKNNSFSKKIYPFLDSFIPLFSYLGLKKLWRVFYEVNLIEKVNTINNNIINIDYFDFIKFNDYHRNAFDPFFFNLLKNFFNESNNIQNNLRVSDNSFIISISYLGYIFILIFISLIIRKLKILFLNKRFNKQYVFYKENNILNILKKLLKIKNMLLFALIIDLSINLWDRYFFILIPNIINLYNQLYISRLVSVYFHLFYFLAFYFLLYIAFLILFEMIRKLKFSI